MSAISCRSGLSVRCWGFSPAQPRPTPCGCSPTAIVGLKPDLRYPYGLRIEEEA
jgi:hypothetical protein